jgi:hypothetical protein
MHSHRSFLEDGAAKHKYQNETDEKYEEQNFSNVGGPFGNSSESENGSDDCDHEEYCSPA